MSPLKIGYAGMVDVDAVRFDAEGVESLTLGREVLSVGGNVSTVRRGLGG
jgi:hypothetical protein